MVIKVYTVAQLFLCQPLKTGSFLKLKLIKEYFLVHETLPSSLVKCTLRLVPSSDSTQWNIYLRAPEQAGWTGEAHTLIRASKHERNFLGGLGAVFPGSLIMWIIIHVVSAVLNEQKRGYLKEGQKERGSSQIFTGSHCQALFALYFFASLSENAIIPVSLTYPIGSQFSTTTTQFLRASPVCALWSSFPGSPSA